MKKEKLVKLKIDSTVELRPAQANWIEHLVKQFVNYNKENK